MQQEIERAWEDRALLKDPAIVRAIEHTIELLDKGEVRVAEPVDGFADGEGRWKVNDWVKKAVILYFPIRGMETLHAGPLEFHDKMR
ncbi:MAG TPA: 2,3,4,5-tetrahydropyridine-2,6-dicarboxylate N-succinyltransferase, partial [Flavobacteriales bacterium]|nr:2,3,4,5-tetrahydropyridine-2,6-dicarboxylate N-succinyltransferase [Flavobacteriales bacterium]